MFISEMNTDSNSINDPYAYPERKMRPRTHIVCRAPQFT